MVAPVSAGMIAEAVTLLVVTAEVLKLPVGDIVVVEAVGVLLTVSSRTDR